MLRDGKQYNINYDLDGNPLLVDPATGEVTQGFLTPVFPGDKITTPAQQEANRNYIDSIKRAVGRRTASRDLGKYFFIAGGQRFSDVKPQTAARLVYLQTYCDFAEEKGNRLKLSTKRDMRRSDLHKVLGLSYDATNSFWKEVCGKYLLEDENGLIFSHKDVFVRGKIEPGCKYYRAYVRGVRKLYEETPKSKHKHLGYVFSLFPFINTEFNVLCFNPDEKDIDRIEFMTLSDFCDLIGFEKSNLHRLLAIYRGLRFTAKNNSDIAQTERFVSVVYDGIDQTKARIFINPRIVYSGSAHEQVQILGAFCKE